MDAHQPAGLVTALLAWIEVAALSLELLAVGIIIVVALLSTALFTRGVLAERRLPAAYERYKVQLGRGLLLGLEMLVAADVVRTVAQAGCGLLVGHRSRGRCAMGCGLYGGSFLGEGRCCASPRRPGAGRLAVSRPAGAGCGGGHGGCGAPYRSS